MKQPILKFSVFADLHYKKGMYAQSVQFVEQILERAHAASVDFVLHAGDFCNDYVGSPELFRAYLQNPQGLAVYGVIGNHEMESEGNSVAEVTARLSNDPDIVWGDPAREGGYYYFDVRGLRIVCMDSNYSYNEAQAAYEHNRTASWGAPTGNTREDSLGPKQLTWLSRILTDAADRGMRCIVVSHASVLPGLTFGTMADSYMVMDIFSRVNARRPGTVLMAVNGHYHTNHIKEAEGILWLDVNTAGSGFWQPQKEDHYGELTYTYTEYDRDGNPVGTVERPLREARMSQQTWYFARPLSAIVTVYDDGSVDVEGDHTEWMHGIAPHVNLDGVMPEISSYSYIPE